MPSSIIIALDAMGGDHGPPVVVQAALNALKIHDDLQIILVGDTEGLVLELKRLHTQESDKLRIHHASEVVGMDEPPALALRLKKDSSMRVAVNLVKQGQAHACVSAGNTGALMATARFVLKTLKGIDRPVISALLPTMKPPQNVRVLDLGANIDSSAEQLFQFAVMGSVLASAVGNIPNPRVALLNIGEEDIKGTEQIKKAAKMLAENPYINYIGFVEGDDIYKGEADVVVCDGFVGNVALKTSEGLARLIAQYIRNAFKRNWMTKLSALVARPALRDLANRLDPARYNGASLVGLQGIVIKSHGNASALAFTNAINEAILEAKNNVPQRISVQVSEYLQEKLVL